MQNYNWDLKTQFVFPEEYGLVEDVVSIDIKPRFQLIETEESLRLVGIYHITSTVRFDPYELPEYSEGTFIEHLELNGNDGYFEYALPLEVNLPKEKVPMGCHPELFIEDIHYDVNDGSCATFNWDVCCTISEPVMEPVVEEEVLFQSEPYLENSIPLEIPSNTAFEELIQEPNFEMAKNMDNIETIEEPISLEEHKEEQLVEITDDPNLVEGFTNVEPEAISQPSNPEVIEVPEELEVLEMLHEPEIPEQEQLAVNIEQENHQLDDFNELVEAENLFQQDDVIDRAFEDEDFFASLSESYTLLDLKSNKVSPE